MNFPQRKSPRASWIEYNGGTYFITICTHNKQHYFGSIQNEEIKLSLIGKILAEELNQISTHYPYIELLQYVVMPNHFHALVNIVDVSHQTDAARCVPTEVRFNKELKEKRLPLLSTFIRGLKSAVTRRAHQIDKNFEWQSRYHDHAIRNLKDFNNISLYIENNILQWQYDCFNKTHLPK